MQTPCSELALCIFQQNFHSTMFHIRLTVCVLSHNQHFFFAIRLSADIQINRNFGLSKLTFGAFTLDWIANYSLYENGLKYSYWNHYQVSFSCIRNTNWINRCWIAVPATIPPDISSNGCVCINTWKSNINYIGK